MTAFAYYNEIEPFAADWLRNLIAAGHIAPGVVDTRSIEDVRPSDLVEFKQCHFFAGIGVWSLALRRAGWSDSDRVWTGSCPCQPFSSAGKGGGFDDQRHLWPHFHYLIEECRPPVVLGEQVASADGLAWLDLVQADLEATDYASAAADLCAAGVGAPHIRQRLYWVAHASDERQHRRRAGSAGYGGDTAWVEPERLCDAVGLADNHGLRLEQFAGARLHADLEHDVESLGCAGGLGDTDSERTRGLGRGLRGPVVCVDGKHSADHVDAPGAAGGVGNNNNNTGLQACERPALATERRGQEGRAAEQPSGALGGGARPAGPTNGRWRDADWLLCRDGKWRPVEPGTFPLAHGATSRVGRLRAYGNAINAEQAEIFIRAVMGCMP